MIQALIADSESRSVDILKHSLATYCPQVVVESVAFSNAEACQMIQDKHPQLLFLQLELICGKVSSLLEDPSSEVETIVLSSTQEIDRILLHLNVIGYLFRPIEPEMLINVVYRAHHWIVLKQLIKTQAENYLLLQQLLCQSPPHDMIGIPTLEGIEFLRIEEIVRCEGLNSFTRILLSDGSGIISSYNIGAFRKLLAKYGFFSPHKSHLINLQYIRKYLLDGILLLRDGSRVPVARRRRNAFLEQITHL